MEKAAFMKTRVTETLKAEFDDIAREYGKLPTVLLREVIEEFVHHNYHKLSDRIRVRIHKPEDYKPGAWRVTIKLRKPSEALWGGAHIPFEMPDLPKRRFASDPEYRAVVISRDTHTHGGRFIDGEWRGHLYSNGCPESENPTSIEAVEQALIKTIEELLTRFSTIKNPQVSGNP
jgi:hypothetical protein